MTVATIETQIRELAHRRASEKSRQLSHQDSIRIAVEQQLQASQQPSVRAIHCQFHEGVLVLSGHVNSFYLKQIAQEIVRKIDGVDVVINAITVAR